MLSSETLEMLRGLSIDCVVHCAAVIPKQFLGKEAKVAAGKNLRMDRNIIELYVGKNANLIFLSGTSVDGLDFDTPRTQNSPTNPVGPYADVKLVSENNAITSLGLNNATILRISASYGPGQKNKPFCRYL